jgi:hypothetical protein
MVGVFDVARPLAVAMATLIQRQHAISLREMQTDEIPGMRGLVAAMQQHDRWRVRVAPFEKMEPLPAQNDVA